MRPIIFSLYLVLGFLPISSFASQWVGCSNDDYSFDFVVNSEANLIGDFSFYFKDKLQNTKNWVVKKKQISFENKKIELVAVEPGGELRLRLRTKYKKGTLLIGGRSMPITCDWDHWS